MWSHVGCRHVIHEEAHLSEIVQGSAAEQDHAIVTKMNLAEKRVGMIAEMVRGVAASDGFTLWTSIRSICSRTGF